MLNFINLIDIFEWEVNLIRLLMCVRCLYTLAEGILIMSKSFQRNLHLRNNLSISANKVIFCSIVFN